MISDFAHDIEALNEVRKNLEKAIDDYLASGRQITYLEPEPEPEAVHSEWLNHAKRVKLVARREQRRNKVERAA